MRNYHLHHPFDDSPATLPWPTNPPKTVRELADLTRSHAKATMQTPAKPPLRDLGQQAAHPLLKPHASPAPPPSVPPKRARRKRGAPAPNQAGKAATSQPPAPPPTHPANQYQASSSSSIPLKKVPTRTGPCCTPSTISCRSNGLASHQVLHDLALSCTIFHKKRKLWLLHKSPDPLQYPTPKYNGSNPKNPH